MNEVAVKIDTDFGMIAIAVNVKAAPKIAAFFLSLIDRGQLAGRRFWRTGHLAGDTARGRFIEGGLLDRFVLGEGGPIPATIAQSGLPYLADWETTGQSGLRCRRGSVFLARDLTGGTHAVPDFVIALEDLPELDEGGSHSPGNTGFPVFGRVVSGLETAERIAALHPAETSAIPFLNGQVLAQPAAIRDVTRA